MALQRAEMSGKNKFETGANANVAGDDVSHQSEDGAWRFLGESMAEGGGPYGPDFIYPIDRDVRLATDRACGRTE
jgi:hypothetical protein